MGLEVEIKARIEDLEALRDRLRGLAAVVTEPRVFEDNYLLDDGARSMVLRGEVLRVRQIGEAHAVLTWKGLKSVEDGVKTREEVEVGAASAASLLEIFAHLGFKAVFRYQKYRETWRVGASQVMVDETPAGNFVEIEGDRDQVHGVRRDLGISDAQVTADTYASLFRRILAEAGDSSEQMVFRGRL